MGRAPCCDKANVKRGPWSPEEDAALRSYLEAHGTAGNWIALPKKAGLRRCGKSCRLRWLNYLRPDIKHGGFTEEEDNVIIGLYGEIGSRWSVIASQLPGRTDNDVKNYWNTKLKKKLLSGKINLQTPNNNTGASNNTSSNSSLGTNNNDFGPEIQHYYNYQALSNTSDAGVDPTTYSTLFTDCHYRPCLNSQVLNPKIGSFVDLRGNLSSSMTQTFSKECLSSVNSSGNSPNSLGAPIMDNENRIMSSSFATNGRLDGGPSFGFGFSWDMLINELLFDEKLGGEIRPGGVLAEVNPQIPNQSPINFQY